MQSEIKFGNLILRKYKVSFATLLLKLQSNLVAAGEARKETFGLGVVVTIALRAHTLPKSTNIQ